MELVKFLDGTVHFPLFFLFLDGLVHHSVIYVIRYALYYLRWRKLKTKTVCLIVLTCPENSETAKKELEETVISLKKLKNWKIEKVTLLEDRRNSM